MTATTKPTLGRGDMRRLWMEWEGDFIRALRCDRDMTQTELADAAGFRHKQSVSLVETGKMHCPPERMRPLAVALDVDPPDFGRTLLRFQNPWLYSLIFGADARLDVELSRAARQRAIPVTAIVSPDP